MVEKKLSELIALAKETCDVDVGHSQQSGSVQTSGGYPHKDIQCVWRHFRKRLFVFKEHTFYDVHHNRFD